MKATDFVNRYRHVWYYNVAYYGTYFWVILVLIGILGYGAIALTHTVEILGSKGSVTILESQSPRKGVPVIGEPSHSSSEKSSFPGKFELIAGELWSFSQYALAGLFALYCLSFVLVFVDMGKRLAVIANRASLMAIDLSKLVPDETH
jgi:hypothetical protein